MSQSQSIFTVITKSGYSYEIFGERNLGNQSVTPSKIEMSLNNKLIGVITEPHLMISLTEVLAMLIGYRRDLEKAVEVVNELNTELREPTKQ